MAPASRQLCAAAVAVLLVVACLTSGAEAQPQHDVVQKVAAQLAADIVKAYPDNIAEPLVRKNAFLAQDLLYLQQYQSIVAAGLESCAKEGDPAAGAALALYKKQAFDEADTETYKVQFPAAAGVVYTDTPSEALKGYLDYYLAQGKAGCAPQAASMALCLCGYNQIVNAMTEWLKAHPDTLGANDKLLVDNFIKNNSGGGTSCNYAMTILVELKFEGDEFVKVVQGAYRSEGALWGAAGAGRDEL